MFLWLDHQSYPPLPKGRRKTHQRRSKTRPRHHCRGPITQLDVTSIWNHRRRSWESLCVCLDTGDHAEHTQSMAEGLPLDILHYFGDVRECIMFYPYLFAMPARGSSLGHQDSRHLHKATHHGKLWHVHRRYSEAPLDLLLNTKSDPRVAYNTFVDASLALIPSTIFWSLQMSFHEKITLSIVFALNILSVPAKYTPIL
jgi:hypothetical protein